MIIRITLFIETAHQSTILVVLVNVHDHCYCRTLDLRGNQDELEFRVKANRHEIELLQTVQTTSNIVVS